MKIIGIGEADLSTIFTHALMGISIGDLASLAHHILQLGPIDARAEIFDLKSKSGSVGSATSTTTATSGSRARSGASTAASATATSTLGNFDPNPFSEHSFTVQITNGVIGIPRGAKVDKAKSIPESDMFDLVIAEKILDIALAHIFRDVSNVNRGHFFRTC